MTSSRLFRKTAMLAALSVWSGAVAAAADLKEAEGLFQAGRYDDCAGMAAGEIGRGYWSERWVHWKILSDLARGRDAEALASLEPAVRRFPASLDLHWLARDVYRYNGRPDDATTSLNAIEILAGAAPQRYATPEGLVALGRFYLSKGADARKVLDRFYDIAIKQQPEYVEAYLASAELALEKQDYALAATTLRKVGEGGAGDPRFHYLRARAFSSDDRAQSTKAIAEALKINPDHADSLLLQADHLIDSEKYDEAANALDKVIGVNPREARAWAYRAAIAHLKNDPEGEATAHKSAMKRWGADPEVDHLIGRKLSQKYRFAEGSGYQRQSLGHDPESLPAKLQLCQDLLRLGDESEGWKLAAEVFARDGYNIVAYNLITLRDRLATFRTLEGDGFVVRMDPREADLYGPRVLALLREAKARLSETYGVDVKGPVTVEIFPQKKEFAVRTFGLPGADGLLGVCFGPVITANSPASQGESPSNWEAVLWHEYCHVVTLTKTRNKMPRWLSEGISVYEEARRDPAWGTPFNPKFRAMVLDDDMTPLSKLSAAFLGAESSLHLQFAYFESALAVEFLAARSGLPAMKALLDDLGKGTTINEALPARTKMTLDELDREFAKFATERARKVAPEATWEEPELAVDADSNTVATWLEKNPKNFYGVQRLASRLVAEEKWEKAKVAVERLKTLDPDYVGPENAYVLLAAIARKTTDTKAEHVALEALVARDAGSGPAILRLMELDESAKDWPGLAKNARRLLAVNPLIPAPHRALAHASEALGRRDDSIAAYRALAILDTTDPAEVHYRLAKLLKQDGKPDEARREVLKSLEEAPRFLDAHKLLLELVGPAGTPSNGRKPVEAPRSGSLP